MSPGPAVSNELILVSMLQKYDGEMPSTAALTHGHGRWLNYGQFSFSLHFIFGPDIMAATYSVCLGLNDQMGEQSHVLQQITGSFSIDLHNCRLFRIVTLLVLYLLRAAG